MKFEILDIQGKNINNVNAFTNVNVENINNELLNNYIRVHMNNQRQGNANTKTRAEVRGGGKKPHKQKGTGRARAGSIRSPIWKGGGVIHGPCTKNWKKRLTKQMTKTAFQNAFAHAINKKMIIVVNFKNTFARKCSTKKAYEFINKVRNNSNQKILIINNNSEFIYKSMRNINNIKIKPANTVNAYDILSVDKVVIISDVINILEKRL